MKTPTKIKIVAVIAALAGPFLAFQGYTEKQKLAALEKDGVTVEATIEGGEWSKGKRGSRSYNFDVNYAPQTGAPQKQTFKVTSDFFISHATEEAITDPKCQVRYLPADVTNAIVVGGSSDDTALFPVGIGLAIAGNPGCPLHVSQIQTSSLIPLARHFRPLHAAVSVVKVKRQPRHRRMQI